MLKKMKWTMLVPGSLPAIDSMPWEYRTYTDNEMKAIQLYLQQVK